MDFSCRRIRFAPAAFLTLACAGQAMAASPSAILTINQYDTNGSISQTWMENMTGLISYDAGTGNFAMLQGASGQIYQDGGPDHPDYWSWQVDATTGAGYWNWHSAETLSGATPTTTTAADPWMTVARLTNVTGHGDPDLSYGFVAKNNTASTQNYTFTIGEAIVPPVGGANSIYADFGASLSNPSGNLTIAPAAPNAAIQQFMLSSDGGLNFVNAGVDVGTAHTTGTIGTSSYPIASATAAGPAGDWNYMQIVTSFTLSPDKDLAAVSGFASITPVPEPSAYGMLAAGLGLLGFMARRNRTGRHAG